MKNQNDVIFSVCAFVLLLIVGCLCFFMSPKPNPPAAPDAVNTTRPALPTNVQPILANSLPSASSSSGGFGGGMGRMGGPGGAIPRLGTGMGSGAAGGPPTTPMAAGAAGGGG